MAGQIEIITWLFCVYLCYKGFEIIQRVLLSPKPHNKTMLIISWLLFAGAVFIAIGTFLFMEIYMLETFKSSQFNY